MASASTIKLLTDSLTKVGITNTYVQQGIVGVVGEESGYVPKSELSYKNTPNERLHEIFGTRLAKYTDQQLTALKANDVAFYDVIYGGQFGNSAVGDGWKYRGRGLNQVTFRNQYQKYGTAIGVDLVSNPDRLNELPIAAAVAAAYFADTINAAQKNGTLQSKFGIANVNQTPNVQVGASIALQANAGFGTNINTTYFQSVYQKVINNIKANPLPTAIGGVILFAGLFFLTYKIFSHD